MGLRLRIPRTPPAFSGYGGPFPAAGQEGKGKGKEGGKGKGNGQPANGGRKPQQEGGTSKTGRGKGKGEDPQGPKRTPPWETQAHRRAPPWRWVVEEEAPPSSQPAPTQPKPGKPSGTRKARAKSTPKVTQPPEAANAPEPQIEEVDEELEAAKARVKATHAVWQACRHHMGEDCNTTADLAQQYQDAKMELECMQPISTRIKKLRAKAEALEKEKAEYTAIIKDAEEQICKWKEKLVHHMDNLAAAEEEDGEVQAALLALQDEEGADEADIRSVSSGEPPAGGNQLLRLLQAARDPDLDELRRVQQEIHIYYY